jgi:hypothetical protein
MNTDEKLRELSTALSNEHRLEREIERLRDVVRRCEWWLSTHPEGEAMRDVCRAALTPSE